MTAEPTLHIARDSTGMDVETVTSALLGTLRADPRRRAEFFALAGVPS